MINYHFCTPIILEICLKLTFYFIVSVLGSRIREPGSWFILEGARAWAGKKNYREPEQILEPLNLFREAGAGINPQNRLPGAGSRAF